MGKDTFQNLPADRRRAFTKVALEEFAQHRYNDASVSHIVRRLGMAKGSFYQYFADKKALYFYLKEQAEAKKKEYLQRAIEQPYADFWELYRQLYIEGIQFEFNHPQHAALLYNFSQEKALPETTEMLKTQFEGGIIFFRDIFIREQAAGRLSRQTDPALMAYVVMQIGQGMGDWLAWKHNIVLKPEPNQASAKPARDELLRLVDEVIQLLKSGMQP